MGLACRGARCDSGLVAALLLSAALIASCGTPGPTPREPRSTRPSSAGAPDTHEAPASNDYLSVAAGGRGHACAVRARDGAVLCWGRNDEGQAIPLGAELSRAEPEFVEPGSDAQSPNETVLEPTAVFGVSGATSVVAGVNHTCALVRGQVTCWGVMGEAGTQTPRVVPGLTDVVAIQSSSASVCALARDGTVRCWGRLHSGAEESLEPSRVEGIEDVRQLFAGRTRMYAVDRFGRVFVWQIGDAAEWLDWLDPPAQLAPGSTVLCWSSDEAEVSCSRLRREWEPPFRVPEMDGAARLTASRERVCGVRGDTLHCVRVRPRLRSSTTVTRLSDVRALAMAALDGCALEREGPPRCWGRLSVGPVPIVRSFVPGLSDARSLVAGRAGFCALRPHRVTCWRRAPRADDECPEIVPRDQSALAGATALTYFRDPCAIVGGQVVCSGLEGTFAIPHSIGATSLAGRCFRFDDEVRCWSLPRSGPPELWEVEALRGLSGTLQRGDCVTSADRGLECWRRAQFDSVLPAGVRRIDEGGCALDDGGRVRCSTREASVLGSRFIETEITDAVDVSGRLSDGCVVHRDGRVSCWGSQLGGQPHDLSEVVEGARAAVEIPGLRGAASVRTTDFEACALLEGGRVTCWRRDPPSRRAARPIEADTAPVVCDEEPGFAEAYPAGAPAEPAVEAFETRTLTLADPRDCARRGPSVEASEAGIRTRVRVDRPHYRGTQSVRIAVELSNTGGAPLAIEGHLRALLETAHARLIGDRLEDLTVPLAPPATPPAQLAPGDSIELCGHIDAWRIAIYAGDDDSLTIAAPTRPFPLRRHIARPELQVRLARRAHPRVRDVTPAAALAGLIAVRFTEGLTRTAIEDLARERHLTIDRIHRATGTTWEADLQVPSGQEERWVTRLTGDPNIERARPLFARDSH